MDVDRKVLALLTSLILALSILPITYALGEQAPDQKALGEQAPDQKARIIINILNGAKERAEEAISSLEASNITIPEDLSSLYKQGLSIAEQAISLYNQTNYERAMELAITAMNIFKKVAKKAGELSKEVVKEELAEAEKAIGLRVAINRTYLFLDKVESLVYRAEEEGYNVTAVKDLIATAREHLANATSKLDGGDIDGAANELASARGIIGRAMGLVHALTEGIEKKRAESFIEKASGRLEQVEARIKALNISESVKSKILSALEDARSKIEMARSMVKGAKIDVSSMLKALHEFKHKEDEALEKVEKERPKFAESLKEIMKLHAKALSLSDEAEKLAAEGFNVSFALRALNQTTGIVGNVSALSEEDVEHVKEMLKKVEDFLEDLKEEKAAEHKAEVQSLIEEVEGKINEVKSRIDQLRENGTEVPQLEAELKVAIFALERAKERLKAGIIKAAEEMAEKASKIVERISSIVEHIREGREMREELSGKLKETLDKLKEKLDELKEKGANVSAIRSLIEKAEALIKQAEEKLAQGKLDEVKGLISAVNGILSQIEKMLQERATTAAEERSEGKARPPKSP